MKKTPKNFGKVFKTFVGTDVAQVGLAFVKNKPDATPCDFKLPIFGEGRKWVKRQYCRVEPGTYRARKISWNQTIAFQVYREGDELDEPVGNPTIEELNMKVEVPENSVSEFVDDDVGSDWRNKWDFLFNTETDGVFKAVKYRNTHTIYVKCGGVFDGT